MRNKLLYILFFAVAFVSKIHSQIPGTTGWVNTEYNTTEGNEFYVTTMRNSGAAGSDQNSIFYLYATAREEVYIKIEDIVGNIVKGPIHIPANDQIYVELEQEYIYTDYLEKNQQYSDEYLTISGSQDKSVYVYTCDKYGRKDNSKPIALYLTSFKEQVGYEATNILPIKALERAYVTQNYHTDIDGTEFAIIATRNYQKFTISIKLSQYNNHDIEKDTIITRNISLNRKGQTCLIRTSKGDLSLSGTAVCSDFNFAIINGNQNTKITKGEANHIFEQALSADKWGKKYIITPTKDHSTDYVLLTAMGHNTNITIEKNENGNSITKTICLKQFETYTDTITSAMNNGTREYSIPIYTADKAFVCYLYEASYRNQLDETAKNFGKPTMTIITPMEMGMNSIILAAFNANIANKYYNPIDKHYVNIVTETKYANNIFIDGSLIKGFQRVPSNPNYSYVLYEITNVKKSHILKCGDKFGTFTARLYGHCEEESYAYSAGSRINRKVDMLVDGNYVPNATICKGESMKFTSIVGFDYENLQWCIKPENSADCVIFNDSIIEYLFPADTINNINYDVQLIVTSKMPEICNFCSSCGDMLLSDTVSVKVTVKASNNRRTNKDVCLGESFEIETNGGRNTLEYIADTSKYQQKPNSSELFKLKVNVPEIFYDTLVNDNGCNMIHIQKITVRTPDTTSTIASICDNQLPYIWRYNDGKDSLVLGTIRGQRITIEKSIEYNNKYGCESLATLLLHVYPSFVETTPVTMCQESSGSTYTWLGHEEHLVFDVQRKKKIKANSIPTDTSGIFIYIDSLKTQSCAECHTCDSIWILNLTIHPSYYHQQDTVLSNEDYIEWQNLYIRGADAGKKNENDIIVTQDTTIVIHNQTTTYLCDSNYTLNIKYGTIFRDTTYDSVCENEHEYTWYRNSNILAKITPLPTQDTTYIVRRQSPIGVDSIFYLNLTIHKVFIDSISREVCQNSGFAKWDVDKDSILDLSSGQWISAQEIPTIQNGIYEYRSTTKVGCDSIWRLFLHVINGYTIDTVASMCDNEIVVWQNKIFKGVHYSGSVDGSMPLIELSDTLNYMDSITYPSAQGCDSTLRIVLNVHPSYIDPVKIDTIDICDNQAYPFYDTIYNSNGEWKINDNITHTYTLEQLDISINGCDSAIMHVVQVHPSFENPTEYDTICESALPYNYKNSSALKFQGLTRSGIYKDTLHTIYGCDSILTLQLTVNPSSTYKKQVTWCQSDGPYSFNNLETTRLHELTESGIYRDTLVSIRNIYGCDSIIELHLTILDSIVIPLHVSVCDNELPYHHPDTTAKKLQNLTKSGIYRDTLISISGCDSVLVLHLQVHPTYTQTDTIVICGSDENPFIWMPTDHLGQRKIPIPFSADLSVNTDNKQTIIINDSSVLLESIYGCDSLVNLHLIIHPTYQFVQRDSVCQDPINKYWTWQDQQGGIHDSIDISQSGWITVGDTLKTKQGCDSIFGIQLYVKPMYIFDSVYTICQNERIEWQGRKYSGNHYGWHYERRATDSIDIHQDTIHYEYEPGDIILEAGTHYDTITYTTSLGCDSIYCLQLIVLPTNNSIQDIKICDKEEIYVFQTTDQYGNYYDTIYIEPITRMIDSVRKDTAFYERERKLKTIDDCDSIVYLHLTVYPTYEYITHTKICERETYEWRGKKYYKTGVYYDSLSTQRGCDSIYILELYVKPVYYITKTIHACDNQVVMHSDTLWYDKDSVRFTIDSTLLWKPGMRVPDPDEYREVRYRSEDDMCDSIVYSYQIFIHPTYNHNVPDTTICSNGSYKLHDNWFYQPDILYYEPGVIINPIDTFISDTLKTITCVKCKDQGCDSIYAAKIRILPAYKHVDKDTICSHEVYIWQNRSIQESIAGTYVYDTIFTTIHGCDSIYELELTIDQSYDTIISDTICADEYYIFNGKSINTAGIYTDTLQTKLGCDSIIHLHLTVQDTTIVITEDTICYSEKYHYFGEVYTEPGIYDTITTNEWGCKQYNYLHLEVIDTTVYTISIGDVICADDEEIIVEYERLSGKTLIEYSVLFDELGHAQGFEDIHHAKLDTTRSYFTIPIPRGEILPHPDPTYFDSQQGVNDYIYEDKYAYPIPNLYTFKLIMHNGICGDSLQRKDTTISFWYPSWIHEQHWNDGIVLYNEIYNGGYEFSKYQWFLNGDSIHGATKEYLYVPNQLEMNQRGECDNYYQLALTRLEDGYTTFTCPICPVLLNDTIVPQKDYFSVVPTIVSKDNPTIHILSTRPGSYKITNLMGYQKQDEFVPDANNYAGSIKLDEYLVPRITSQLILVTLTLDTGDNRTIKVIIGN